MARLYSSLQHALARARNKSFARDGGHLHEFESPNILQWSAVGTSLGATAAAGTSPAPTIRGTGTLGSNRFF